MPIQARQLQVQQDERWPCRVDLIDTRAGAEQEFERLDAVARDVDRISEIGALEGEQRELDVIEVVLDQQDVGALVKHDPGLSL